MKCQCCELFSFLFYQGLIKIRGDQCWRDLTCMNYHYETQPVPNPISYFMHQSPEIFHKFETLTNHFVELVVPWFLIGPRRLCMIGGTIQILFQVRCWNRSYGQFSVIWHAWYFVQLEWHLHNINVLYSSFLHERIIKISFDIVKMDKRCCLITLYFILLMILCYLSRISDHYQGQKMFSFSDTAMQ